MKPKVSIITATRHRPDFLRRCILAVQAQELVEHEHLIVADHCPYARHVYEQFKDDPRITFLELDAGHVLNDGAVGKNKAIEVSRAGLICYCDDDNILLPNHTRVLYTNLTSSGADLAYSKRFALFCARHSYAKLLQRHPYDIWPYDDIDSDDMLCCMHTRDAIERAGGWRTASEVGHDEDGDLMKRFEALGLKTNHLDDVTCVYNAHHGCYEEKNIGPKREYRRRLEEMTEGQRYAYPEIAAQTIDLSRYPLRRIGWRTMLKWVSCTARRAIRKLLRLYRERRARKTA